MQEAVNKGKVRGHTTGFLDRVQIKLLFYSWFLIYHPSLHLTTRCQPQARQPVPVLLPFLGIDQTRPSLAQRCAR